MATSIADPATISN